MKILIRVVVPFLYEYVVLIFAAQYKKNLFFFQDFDDAFYVFDLGDTLKKHRRWLREFPRIQPFYAIKVNPDPTLLKILVSLGTGFDCASKVG